MDFQIYPEEANLNPHVAKYFLWFREFNFKAKNVIR